MVGKELKQWRELHGLTLADLAKEVGVTWNTIIRWEMDGNQKGKRRPTSLTRPLLERAMRRIESKSAAGAAA